MRYLTNKFAAQGVATDEYRANYDRIFELRCELCGKPDRDHTRIPMTDATQPGTSHTVVKECPEQDE